MTDKSFRKRRNIYVWSDYFATLAGVMVFEIVRYNVVPDLSERFPVFLSFLGATGVLLTLVMFPVFMLALYYISGYYIRVYDKSRVGEFLQTIGAISIGCGIFFMVVLLNDVLPRRRYNYEILLLLFTCIFVVVYPVRLCLTSHFKAVAKARGLKRAILVTRRQDAKKLMSSLAGPMEDLGMMLAGVYNTDEAYSNVGDAFSRSILEEQFKESGADCFIFDVPDNEEESYRMLGELLRFGKAIYVQPSPLRVVLGTVRFDAVFHHPLVDVSRITLPDTVVAVKRSVDIVLSAVGLLLTSPLTVALAILVKCSSSGPVFYRQERLGYMRRPFMLYKFRSMIEGSEPAGPQLSSDDDPRITRIGRVMRRYRLDEIPNLWNVLKGDMSIVGPRPEREYFVNKILEKAPHYTLIQQVRPGVTSWGMVKYGYASDVDQMIERLTYDLLYVQNLSLSLDIKICFYTLRTLLRGEGK